MFRKCNREGGKVKIKRNIYNRAEDMHEKSKEVYGDYLRNPKEHLGYKNIRTIQGFYSGKDF